MCCLFELGAQSIVQSTISSARVLDGLFRTAKQANMTSTANYNKKDKSKSCIHALKNHQQLIVIERVNNNKEQTNKQTNNKSISHTLDHCRI